MTPSATPLATFEAFGRAKDAACGRWGSALTGRTPPRTTPSAVGREFSADAGMLGFARRLQLPVQVNTTITRRNVGQVDAIADLLAAEGIATWSVFFLVPVGRGRRRADHARGI